MEVVQWATENALRMRVTKKNNSKDEMGKNWTTDKFKNDEYSKSESKGEHFL